LDPVPTWLVKKLSNELEQSSPINAMQRTLPVDQKRAIMRPLLKKPSLDMSDLNNYRPISNLSFLSKTAERLVDAQFTAYSENSSPLHQSA